MIEHPVGPGKGFWTVFEAINVIKKAFHYDVPELGQMGKNAWRIF